jgi:moderate conductance mechanosensitive channel
VTEWLLTQGVRMAAVAGAALVLVWLVRRTVPRALRLAMPPAPPPEGIDADVALEEYQRRTETLAHVLVRSAAALVLLVALTLVLAEAGFAVAPLIAGAGIAGIAIGFGAQTLVRDVLAGVFILAENQYGKGDVVRVAGIAGVVEDVNLRRTLLRDIDGIVHSVSNGEITTSSNLTRAWSRVNLNVSVAYREDLDRVTEVLNRVGEELAADPEWAERMLEPPSVLRVDGFEESGIALKVMGKVKPMTQWDVAGELRRRIKRAFDSEGIEIPFPHRVAILRDERRGADEG